MDLQEFKNTLEIKLSEKQRFQLEEFHYHGYAFGSGILVYHINGYNYKLTYDGRDGLLTIQRSGHHEKHPHCKWTELTHFKNLNDDAIEKTVNAILGS